jgi:NAD(P)-dependent dehydrogenase (short-subunit alcohol dehydrogenase family)
MRTLSLEWGPRGIRLVAIAPGLVHTEAWERYGVDPAEAAESIPVQRLQSVDDIASLAAFLLSPAGDYITGTTIVADGGFELPNVVMQKALL